MDRMYLNQTALSLGYIALKRIRALDAPTPRQPSSPLLRHVGHIKILAACVEQVGPEEIIEYEINQDYGIGGSVDPPDKEVYHVEDAAVTSHESIAHGGSSESRYASSRRAANANTPLSIIKEDADELGFNDREVPTERPRRTLAVTSVDPIDFSDDAEYSMDELYDEYNTQEDDWETASDVSDEEDTPTENTPPSNEDQPHSSPRSFISADTDSEEEDIPCTPPNMTISRSPPLNIATRHPITHELTKREQYRRQMEPAGSALSHSFVEQFETVLCQEMRNLSVKGISGDMRFGNHANQRVSLFA